MIKYIKYQNEKHPVRISYYALKHTSEDTGTSLEKLTDKGNDSIVFEKLLYYGLKAGYRAEGKGELPEELSEENIEFVLDEIFFEFTEMIKDFFPSEKQKAVGGKKKLKATDETTDDLAQ